MSRRTLSAVGAAAVVLLALLAWGRTADDAGEVRRSSPSAPPAASPTAASATPSADAVSGLPWIAARDLPAEARRTLRLIDAGGPFPYPGKDGSAFGNFEGHLPEHRRGYYAEYTVPTPGERDRGSRRIIVGDGGERYWTADHYDSFARVAR